MGRERWNGIYAHNSISIMVFFSQLLVFFIIIPRCFITFLNLWAMGFSASLQSRCQKMWRDLSLSLCVLCIRFNLVHLFVFCYALWQWHVTQIIAILLTWSISLFISFCVRCVVAMSVRVFLWANATQSAHTHTRRQSVKGVRVNKNNGTKRTFYSLWIIYQRLWRVFFIF